MKLITVLRRVYASKLIHNIRLNSTASNLNNDDITRIRNIGILAHIDAGKTTTTERMLYYSGLIDHMGEVHHGNTVTDFMSQERERGITITSASVTFNWKKHQFNLIDTPGHIDFTMEVEQTLNVLDGAVVILDGSAGVEAQTLTVWRQADRYKIPRIIFVNKMDRADANLALSCKSIREKLEIPVLCLQLPLKENGVLKGVVDILKLEKIIYDKGKDKQLTRVQLSEEDDKELFHEAKVARARLVDRLCEYNDYLADQVILKSSLDEISTRDIVMALRQVTSLKLAVPVLIGSAYKNIGIQPLMDSIILYLPSPEERNPHFVCFENNLCARAFKVRHEKQRGALVFFRIYNGELKKGQKLYNIQKENTEQSGKLYKATADELKETEVVTNGNIAVVSGLKNVNSGDMVTSSQSTAEKAKVKMLKLYSKSTPEIEAVNIDSVFSTGPTVPEPVFFCSIEPPSLAYQTPLEQALNELQREDPSLRVTYDSETGQTVLSGMGELHLEIIKDRILKEYKIDAELGALQISYKEAPLGRITEELMVDTKIGNSKQLITVKLSLIPRAKAVPPNELIKLDKSTEAASNLAKIYPKHLAAIKQGVEVGLSHGPKIGSQVINAQIKLHFFEVGRGTSETMITATVTQLVQKMLNESSTHILEPVMYLEIVTPDEHVSTIMADLSRRRTEVENVTLRGNMKVITANVPLSELLGYSTILRTLSSGTASFTMEFNEYKIMSSSDEIIAIKNVRGF